eukprot:TRINITY_DN25163_c0_g3_i1.p1 TRINITY_DN25163_c0_g3~~TRINITY_DN25163_c0_g3_i1.p1  ORF type:complete len:876 (-),score=104.45 TRINITY_DN25163_c0_g3_i1:345-2972(-)
MPQNAKQNGRKSLFASRKSLFASKEGWRMTGKLKRTMTESFSAVRNRNTVCGVSGADPSPRKKTTRVACLGPRRDSPKTCDDVTKLSPESIEKIANEVADCVAAAMYELRATVRLRVAAVAFAARPHLIQSSAEFPSAHLPQPNRSALSKHIPVPNDEQSKIIDDHFHVSIGSKTSCSGLASFGHSRCHPTGFSPLEDEHHDRERHHDESTVSPADMALAAGSSCGIPIGEGDGGGCDSPIASQGVSSDRDQKQVGSTTSTGDTGVQIAETLHHQPTESISRPLATERLEEGPCMAPVGEHDCDSPSMPCTFSANEAAFESFQSETSEPQRSDGRIASKSSCASSRNSHEKSNAVTVRETRQAKSKISRISRISVFSPAAPTMRNIEDDITDKLLADGQIVTCRRSSVKSTRASLRKPACSVLPVHRKAENISVYSAANRISSLFQSTHTSDHVALSGLQKSRINELVESIKEKSEKSNDDSDDSGEGMRVTPTQSAPFWLNATGIAYKKDDDDPDSENESNEEQCFGKGRRGRVLKSTRVVGKWCSRARAGGLGLIVLCFSVMWIYQTSFKYFDNLQAHFQLPLHKFSDVTLCIGSVATLALTPRIRRAGLIGIEGSMMSQYAEMQGFASAWRIRSARDGCKAMVVWLLLVVTHVGCAIKMQSSPGDASHDDHGLSPTFFIGVCALALVSFLCVVLVLCLLHVTDALVLMVDSFCVNFISSPDIPKSIREWNRLQAILRRTSSIMSPCFLVIHTTVAFALLFAIVEAIIGAPDEFFPWLSAILRTSILLFFVCVLTFRAAEVSSRCMRVPSLVNSLNFGLDIDPGRTYLVEYLHHSDACFALFEVKLTAYSALKFVYASVLSTVTIVTKVLASA